MQCRGGVAFPPLLTPQTIAELLRRLLLHQTASADDFLIVQRDQENCIAAGFVRSGNETLGIRKRVRVRNARGVLGDAAVIRQHGYRFIVRKTRRAQGKPLCLEDGNTGLVEGLFWYALEQCHGTGSWFATRLKKPRGGTGPA